jgi:hypothetical protein
MPKTSRSATAFEPSVTVFDACILYPFHLRNILVQAAVDRLVEARWTDQIQNEWIRNLVRATSSVQVERLSITRKLMNDALPAATVSGYEDYIATVNLPDPDDRHVVAAGIAAGATMILTWNLRDFPAKELKKFGLRKQTPDTLLTNVYEKVPDLIIGSLANARRNLSKTRVSASDFLDILANQKLAELASKMRKHRSAL